MFYANAASTGNIKMNAYQKYLDSFTPKKVNQTPDIDAIKKAGIEIEES